MPDAPEKRSFYERVKQATLDGEKLAVCLQCGTCGGSCPSGSDMDMTPRRLFALIAANEEVEVLSSNTPWYCVSCYYCMTRCPKEVPVTDFMYALKQMSIQAGYSKKNDHVDFSNSFIGFIERYGRSFEFGLATRFHLTHHPLKSIEKSGLGFQMMQKGRLKTRPESVKNMPQLTAILDEAKRIAAQEEGWS